MTLTQAAAAAARDYAVAAITASRARLMDSLDKPSPVPVDVRLKCIRNAEQTIEELRALEGDTLVSYYGEHDEAGCA